MSNLPTNEQILALLDINPVFKFLCIYELEIIIGLFIIWCVHTIIDFKKIEKEGKLKIGIDYSAIILFSIFILTEITISRYQLNEEQIKIIKSVENPTFQSVVDENFQKYGKNLYAIKHALKLCNKDENKCNN